MVVAVLLGLMGTAVIGGSASADPRGAGSVGSDPLAEDLAAQARAVSDTYRAR
jgi:hypothetical protein